MLCRKYSKKWEGISTMSIGPLVPAASRVFEMLVQISKLTAGNLLADWMDKACNVIHDALKIFKFRGHVSRQNLRRSREGPYH